MAVGAVAPVGEGLGKLLEERFGVSFKGETKFGLLSRPGGGGVASCRGGSRLSVDVERQGWSGEWGWMELKGFASAKPLHHVDDGTQCVADGTCTGVGYTRGAGGGKDFLLGNVSFPLHYFENSSDLVTMLRVPKPLAMSPSLPASGGGPTYLNVDKFVALLGARLVGKEGIVDTTKALGGTKMVLLYFSASWCPPCKQFTPLLIDFYKKSKETPGLENAIEVVYVWGDRSEADFLGYYEKMPWLSIPYNDYTKMTNQAMQQR